MGLVSWIKNLFVTSDENGRTKRGIQPISNGEPVNESVLNRPLYIIGGRLELLNKELEAIRNNIISRKIIIECMARGWSGYVNTDGSNLTFVPGKVGIPPNTSLTIKLIDMADEWNASSEITKSSIYIGINDGTNKGMFRISTRHTKQYDTNLPQMPYSGDLIVKFVMGDSVSASLVTEEGQIKYLLINYTSNTTISNIVNAINNLNSPYVSAEIIANGSARLLASLSGKLFAANEIWNDFYEFASKYISLSSGNYIIGTYKYVKSLEFDISYNVLLNFWNNRDDGLYPGQVLALRVPSATYDGTITGAEITKASQSVGRITITDYNNLVVLESGATTGLNGLYIPIAKASNPSSDTINRHSKNSDDKVDDLSYIDFADGVRVGSGQIYHEFCKNEDCVSDNGIDDSNNNGNFNVKLNKTSIPDSINVWTDIVTSGGVGTMPYQSQYSTYGILLATYNSTATTYSNFGREGQDFLILRDFMNPTSPLKIKFINNTLRNTYKTSSDDLYMVYTKLIANPDNSYYPSHPMPLPFDFTKDSATIFKNGDWVMVRGELHDAVRALGYAVRQHLSNENRYKHSDDSISGNMIKSGAISGRHIDSANTSWYFPRIVSKYLSINEPLISGDYISRISLNTPAFESSNIPNNFDDLVKYLKEKSFISTAIRKKVSLRTGLVGNWKFYYCVAPSVIEIAFDLSTEIDDNINDYLYTAIEIDPAGNIGKFTTKQRYLGVLLDKLARVYIPYDYYASIITSGTALVKATGSGAISSGSFITIDTASDPRKFKNATIGTDDVYGYAISDTFTPDGGTTYYAIVNLFESPRSP